MLQTMPTHAIDANITRELALRIRKRALQMINRARSSHLGSSLSMADILAVLYSGVLNVSPLTVDAPERDRLILSKGHACAGLYAVLAEQGFFPIEWLDTFYKNGSRLAGHATTSVPGVELSTGSLGHGLPVACGMALAAKRDGHAYRVFTILSDGECDEGSVWEAALFAGHHGLDNLIAIVDYNKIQSLGDVSEVLSLEPFQAKWEAFGWNVSRIDGHDHGELIDAFTQKNAGTGKPRCILADTVKGKGVPFMENDLLWHYRAPDAGEFARASAALDNLDPHSRTL
ncbi:MAG TPA: transketolase [Bryobacteraceae bacterium]|nr:transketolase [Bryobacteraceae bacterium]